MFEAILKRLLIYLAQSLEGEPKEMISGLAITNDNYSIALYI